ncbi:Helix-turn-helix [Paenibacillus uliginis N3/975]|uniref:Helix-turn-helix n=1 Tax=Paenibacillus uliginis N3/975 TaxID=1313296 RepID=A0A1X7HQS0_9BACL|nr:Helix-turn-helix [Paenibacillus uliginis N3/975]
MEPADKTISAELIRYIKKENISISSFADKSGINSGTLSRIINGNQSISVSHLDLITRAMNLEEGYFYTLYADECFMQSSLDWRRLGPFIMRCAELGKLQCIDQVIGMTMDNLSYSSLLFDSAETLYQNENKEAALIIFKTVAESEKYQHAERLALCQYRIFTCSLSQDQENNLECAVQFESYVSRLSESEQLDALKDLTNIFLSLRKWNKARYYAQEMGRISRYLYEQKNYRKKRNGKYIEPKKPLFGYILYSDLLLGAISAENGDYEQALYYLSCYEDQSWIIETDELAELTKNQFREWAIGNGYLYRLMTGNTTILDEYVEYISSRKDEILRALFKIVQAANYYHFDIDKYLERFEDLISDQLELSGTIGSYTVHIMDDRFANFLTDVGLYYLKKDNIKKGFKYILESLVISFKINNTANMVRCCSMIENIRHKLDNSNLQKYAAIMKEVYNPDEEKISGTLIHH